MDTKKLSSVILLSVFLLTATFLRALQPSEKHKTITKLAATIISKQHFRQQPLNDKISSELFEEYFKVLDPNKLYFTKDDIEKFSKYRYKLDENSLEGNLDFAFDVYNLLLQRLAEYRKETDEILKKGFDFSRDEEFVFNRTDTEWAANQKELKELWRKKIKNDVLTFRLMEKASELEKEKEGAEKNKVHPSWSTKSPQERVRKRIHQYVNYMEKNEPIDVLEIYLSSLAKVYDPHSQYLSPRAEEDFNIEMKLSLVGIGALLSSEDGYTKIVKLIPGGPAEKDHRLKPEDRIIAVAQDNEEPVDIVDMPLTKVVRLIRGPKDTLVNLTILEGGKGVNAIPKVITIKRDTVKLKEREAHGKIEKIKLDDGREFKIGLITLPSFYMDFEGAFRGKKDYKSTSRDIKNILEDFKKEDVDGVLVDMRSNGGGSLLEAIKTTGLFIKNGPVVQIKTNPGAIDIKYDSDDEIYYDGPLVVLLNKLSASATEIFSGAIKDYKRGILVGDTHTHGKGVVQTIYELDEFLKFLGPRFPAGSVKFTSAQFYRISGSSTQCKGISPDIIFPSFTDSMEIGEKDLDYALPWDCIKPVEHDYYVKNIEKIIPALKKKSLVRRTSDKKFQALLKDIDSYKKYKDRKTVSLNEKKRWQEYLKEKNIQEEQSRLMKLDTADTDKDKKNEKDIYIDETKKILGDYIESLAKNGNKNNSAKAGMTAENCIRKNN